MFEGILNLFIITAGAWPSEGAAWSRGSSAARSTVGVQDDSQLSVKVVLSDSDIQLNIIVFSDNATQ